MRMARWDVRIAEGMLETSIESEDTGGALPAPPLTGDVDAVMGRPVNATIDPQLLTILGAGKKKLDADAKREADWELEKRVKAAKVTMEYYHIQPDEPDGRKGKGLICKVCRKYCSFKLHGQLPHRTIGGGKSGRPQFRFCPLADDQMILLEYEKSQKEKERKRSRIRRRVAKAADAKG